MMIAAKRLVTFFALLCALAACSVNPVTGEREITFVSEAGEIQMGEQNYLPMQQSQGAIYDVDQDLTAYVSSVGGRLAAVSDRALPYEFVVLNNSVPNAWALPGGKIADMDLPDDGPMSDDVRAAAEYWAELFRSFLDRNLNTEGS